MPVSIIDVNENTQKKFNEKMKQDGVISVVIYHASWCRHCIEFNSNWNQISNHVKSMNKDGILARVEEKNMGLVNGDSSINGYPSIVIYEGGNRKPHMYEGPRDPNSFVLFLKSIFPNSKKKIKTRKSRKPTKSKKSLKINKTNKRRKSEKGRRKNRRKSKKHNKKRIRKNHRKNK